MVKSINQYHKLNLGVMKKIFLATIISLFFTAAFAQKISRVNLTKEGVIESIFFLLDEGVTVSMTEIGTITAWGNEVISERIPSMSKLDVYPGRVEYYNVTENEAFRGKVKYIGRNHITYYGTYDREELQGKVRSIGTAIFEYYMLLDNDAYKGKIKKAGSVNFGWYSSFDNEAFKGKIKSMGNTNFVYYSSFEDKAFKGRIKSIDRFAYTYYSSMERKEFQGAVKSGSQLQNINGMKFFVKF